MVIQNKLLTIIIPTYNMEAYLNRCLSSIVIDGTELMSLFEVIVVNDGSTDSSSEIAHTYEDKYPSIFRVIDKENGNYGSCVNVALKMAIGKYVKILDADDYFEEDAFCKYLLTLCRVDVDAIITDVCSVNIKGEKICPNRKIPLEKWTILSWQALIPFSVSFLFAHHFTFRRQLLIDINYHQTEGCFYTDNEWATYPLTTIQNIYYAPLCIYQYVNGLETQSTSRKVMRKSLDSYRSLLLSLGNLWSNYDGDEQRKYMLYNALYLQVMYIYNLFLFDRLYSFSEFWSFDHDVIMKCPKIKGITDTIIIGGNRLPMPVMEYVRKRNYCLFYLARLRFTIGKHISRNR